MATEYRGTGVTVTRWPVWFQKCFLAADAFARRSRRGATFLPEAYAQLGRGDLICASRMGSADPNVWIMPGKRNSMFFLGSFAPMNAKDYEYSGVGWRPTEEKVLFWLSYFFQHKRMLYKDGEGFVHCWGQASVWDGSLGDPAEQLRLEKEIQALTPP